MSTFPGENKCLSSRHFREFKKCACLSRE